MKKRILAMLMVGVMVIALAAGAGWGKKVEKLVLYSTMTENDLKTLLEGFKAEYPDIEVEVVNGSAGELTARIDAEKGKPQGDVMWGGLNATDGNMYSNLFEHWVSPYDKETMPDYRSNNGFYNLDHLSTVCFCVNKELEKKLGIEIKGYADLLNPVLKGKIVLSDPNSSSAAWNNLSNIMALYGYDSDKAWNYIKDLINNGLVISTSSSVCFKSVETGEYVVGMTYEDGVATLLKSGAANIKLIYPKEGTSALALGCAVIKGAPHLKTAQKMVNYLMSAKGQSFMGNKMGTLRFTNTKAVYKLKYLPPTSEIKWVSRDIKWLIKNREQVLQHWNKLYTSIK